MKIASLLLLGVVFAAAALAQEEKVNDAFLLRQLKRAPDADLNSDGRLTVEEWREYRANAALKKEMNADEAAALKSGRDQGARVSPTYTDVAYGPLPEQRLNLWLVPAAEPVPLIIHIHGGGFIQGEKQATIDEALHQRLKASGVAYASIQYKFQSKGHPLTEVLRGIARSVQFLRLRAREWNLDPQRFGAFGSSAGASASAWLGMHDDLADPAAADPILRQSSRLQAVWAISVAPTLDLWEWPGYNPLFTKDMIAPWLERWGYDPRTDPNDPTVLAWRKELQFSKLASADDAPMVVFNEHFADNVVHNPHASRALYELGTKAGMDVQIYMREELNNLAAAPNQFDWLITRLKSR